MTGLKFLCRKKTIQKKVIKAMKKNLLPVRQNYFKANLHMHTTESDGRMTPEETKAYYKERGYSIVAFTDHDIIAPHHYLNDKNFLTITSMETYFNTDLFRKIDYDFIKTYHLSFFAKDPDNFKCPAFSERYIERAHSLALVQDESRAYDYDREYSQKFINQIIKECNEKGFLVSYNHPMWSLQNYKDYCDLEGLWGVEVFNTAGAVACMPDNEQAFLDLIHDGKKVFPIAADDAHSHASACGGWVMVGADKLEYKTVMTSLENGDFYASSGPEIKEFSFEDGKVFVRCSDAVKIYVNTERRTGWAKNAGEGEQITEAEFNVSNYLNITREEKDRLLWKPFIRLTVVDKSGHRAYTRAYFLEEFIDL